MLEFATLPKFRSFATLRLRSGVARLEVHIRELERHRGRKSFEVEIPKTAHGKSRLQNL